MLRLALLCHLSAVGAVPLATNVQCLPYRTDETFLDLTGAKATALPHAQPQAERLRCGCDTGATVLHNNLGGVAGYYCEACKQRSLDGTSYYRSPADDKEWITCPVGTDCSNMEIESCLCDAAPSQVPGCEGKNVQDQCSTKMGALAPQPTQSSGGVPAVHPVALIACAQSSETSPTLRVPFARLVRTRSSTST